MYRETISFPERKPWQNMLLVLAVVASVIVITCASNMIHALAPHPLWSALPLLFAAALGWVLLRQRIVEYRYSIVEGYLLFSRVMGKRDKQLAQVELECVRWFFPAKRRPSSAPKAKVLSTSYFTLRAFSDRTHLLWHQTDKGLRCICFQPSARLVEILERELYRERPEE